MLGTRIWHCIVGSLQLLRGHGPTERVVSSFFSVDNAAPFSIDNRAPFSEFHVFVLFFNAGGFSISGPPAPPPGTMTSTSFHTITTFFTRFRQRRLHRAVSREPCAPLLCAGAA